MRLVYVGLGWVAGIILAAQITTPGIWIGLSVALLIVVGAAWDSRYRWLNLALLALALGGLRYSFVPDGSLVAYWNNTGGLTIDGIVTDEPDIRDDRTLLRVEVDRINRGGVLYETSGVVMVRAPRRVEAIYGDRITATGQLYTPASYDTFSYADYLARHNVYSLMDHARIEIVSGGHGWTPRATLYDLRRQTIDTIGQYLPEPQASLLTGILLGYERGISPEISDAFSVVGASHVVAISGFNMVIIAGVVMGVLGAFMPNRRGLAATLGILVMVSYTLFAGASPPVLRAAFMSGVLIVAQALNRRTYVPTSLALTVLVLSLLDPNVLWDVGFQLSFFAVLGLAIFVNPLQKLLDTGLAVLFPQGTATRASSILTEPVVVTLAAQITTLPLIVLYFQRLSLVSLPVNLLIVPVQAYLLILGGLATMVALVLPPLAQVLYWFDLLLLSWTIGVVESFAAFPFAETTIAVEPTLIIVYYVVLIGWTLMHATQPDWWLALGRLVRQRMVVTAIVFAGVALLVLMAAIARSRPDDRLHVWFLDVGHSNAILVQSPGGAHLLVDGGRYPSRLLTAIGDRLPFIDRDIEMLVITQPDEFDTGAIPAVLNRYDIGVVLTNGQPNLGEAFAEIADRLIDQQVLDPTAGYRVDLSDGTRIEILHPQSTPELGSPLDESPLVVRLSYGDVSFLLTGDLSTDGQASLLDAGTWPVASVMQLPQHGTARSLLPEFLDAVQPQMVVVQADRANRRGDPDPDVLALLPESVPVLRTDEYGVVHFWTDGETLWSDGYMK